MCICILYVRAQTYMSVYVCLCVYECICLCFHVCTCEWVYVLCACICVYVWLSERSGTNVTLLPQSICTDGELCADDLEMPIH